MMSVCLKQSGMGLHTEAFGLAPLSVSSVRAEALLDGFASLPSAAAVQRAYAAKRKRGISPALGLLRTLPALLRCMLRSLPRAL